MSKQPELDLPCPAVLQAREPMAFQTSRRADLSIPSILFALLDAAFQAQLDLVHVLHANVQFLFYHS